MANTPELFHFRASQIAAALGRSARSIQYTLRDTPIIGGRGSRSWAFAMLPEDLRSRLHEAARAGGFKDAHTLLSQPSETAAPALAFADARECDQNRAVILQRALAPAIARRNDLSLTEAEFNRLGAEDYRRVIGHKISERHFRRLFDRTVERDAGAEQFGNLSLYLDEDAKPSAPPAPPSADAGKFSGLLAIIAGFARPASPTSAEQRHFWDCAFLLLDETGEEGKRELLAFLARHAPFLAKNAGALQRNFNRLFKRWQQGERRLAALDDQRAGRARGPELSDDEFKLLVAYAAKYGGGCDQAWRELLRLGKLRQEIACYYSGQRRRMPRKYREQVVHAAGDAANRLHGPRHAKLTGPHINRNPDHPDNPLLAGQWDQSDDLTLPCVWYETKEAGSLWLGQGQFLAWVDERSWMLYNFVLIPEKGYNAFHIRNSWTKKCDTFGLPMEGLYIERGIWASARVWVGRKDEVPWNKTEEGIRRLGLRVQHAQLPRGKIIERIFGTLQDYFQTEPGYVGRSPLTDKYEEVQKQMRLVRSGQAHPSEFFYSKTEWTQRLAEWCQIYNQTPKHGKYHDGLTPAQVYEKLCPLERIAHIGGDCRHLLASNKIEATIGSKGLVFRYGKRCFTYKCEELGRMKLKDPRVIAWVNPEDMTLCGVTDRDGENPIVARLETDVPSHDAPPELLARAHAENAAFERPGRELYRTLKPLFSAEFEQRRVRPVISDGLAAETGRVFREQGEAVKAEEKSKAQLERRAHKLGLNVARNDPRYEQRVEAASELDCWLSKHDRSEQGKT